MGHCASSSKKIEDIPHTVCEQIEQEKPKERYDCNLSFHAILGNIVLKKYPYKQATPVIKLAQKDIFRFETKPFASEDLVNWKNQKIVDFQMSAYQLKTSLLQVQILNQQNIHVGSVSINLYSIATGPFHQDFAIKYLNGKIGRINFDLKLSQIIQIQIKTVTAQIQLLKDHLEEQFKCSIKSIVGYNGQISQSQHSYPSIVLLKKETIDKLDKKYPNPQIYANEQVQSGKTIQWSQGKGKLPTLTTKILASELHNTYFQVTIWKCKNSKTKQKQTFFADTYVSFIKLFASKAERLQVSGAEFESRNIKITQKIQHYGKDYGKGMFQFNIINQPYFKQYQVCVHTEAGIMAKPPIFTVQNAKMEELCSQMKDLLSISQKIQNDVIKLNKMSSNLSQTYQYRKQKSQIQLNLQRIFNTLEKSSHSPVYLYEYNTQSQLLRGQQILISLGIKTVQYLQIQDPVINDVCWLILISIIKRSQLNLSHLAFHQQQVKSIQNGHINQHLNAKISLIGVFRQFTYKLLNLALNSLNKKGSQYQKIFAQTYCAHAYFQIPQFRREVLKFIVHPSDPEINQWRGIEFSLKDDIESKEIIKNVSPFSELFDWQYNFYRFIKNDEAKADDLNDILSQQQWKQKFKLRGLQFLCFLKYWVSYIQGNLPDKKDIQWRCFPGYNRLLQGLFSQMKKTPILSYPDALLNCCVKLLVNQKLVNPIIKIILNKVNAYNSTEVLRAVGYLNLIFQSFTSKNRSLPISFNYCYFFKCFKIIFQGESSIAISASLTLIYNHFSLFHAEFRRSISMYFLGKIFWKLFLNWSFTVRNIFYHIMTYKIYGEVNLNKKHSRSDHRFQITDAKLIQRYHFIIKMLSNKEAEQNHKKQVSIACDNEYFKKMKLKAYNKMKKNCLSTTSFNVTKDSTFAKELHFGEITAFKSDKTVSLGLLKDSSINGKPYHSQDFTTLKKALNEIREDNEEQGRNRLMLFQKIIHQQQYELQQIEASKIKYIPIYLPQFKKIQRYFQYSFQKQNYVCPSVHYQISIDKRQIRPKQIDNW